MTSPDPSALPLYARLLGDDWARVPPELQALQNVTHVTEAHGRGDIARGTGPLAKLACAIMRFPRAGTDMPLHVHFAVRNGVETWTRDFGGHVFRSRQSFGTGRDDGLVIERFGAMRLGMVVTLAENRIVFRIRRWSFLHIPLPLFLCVRTEAMEWVEDGRFWFSVRVWHPVTGPIIHYKGWLAPANTAR